nr:hypothetical protein [Actinomycetales bacterium]
MKIPARGVLRRTTLLELGPDGILIEETDQLPWSEVEQVGMFENEFGTGLGFRLIDALAWLDEHPPRRYSRVNSAFSTRAPAGQLSDLFGLRKAESIPPMEESARLGWARRITGGWDLTIGASELPEPPAEIARKIAEFRDSLA